MLGALAILWTEFDFFYALISLLINCVTTCFLCIDITRQL